MDRVSLLAHQLKTPLSTITSLAQGLMRRADRLGPEGIKERAEKIRRSSLRLQELIETILSYTRLNTGSMGLDLKPVDLRSLVRRICREQRGQEPTRSFNIDIQDLSTAFTGDPALLEQALAIVLSNAMKYSPPDRPIRVAGTTCDGIVSIVIRDQGIGISAKDLPFLTQPFFRGENVQNIPGTGLGLSLAQHILRLHGGDLQIRSRKGRGTTVTITLPARGPLPEA